jgi:hypothetical protein
LVEEFRVGGLQMEAGMKIRALLATLVALAALILQLVAIPQAQAASGPKRLQRLAADQTQLLFRFYNGQPQTASPPTCSQRQGDRRRHGVLLLPTLSFGSGDAIFTCKTNARAVLLDLAGATVSEDNRGDTWTLADGEILDFARENLPRICDDVLRVIPAASATLDDVAITPTPVVTRNFIVKVNPGADNTPGSPLYQDSIDLGHPGRLAACYSGYKALVPISPGHHVIHVDLSAIVGAPTEFTYDLTVKRHD